MLNPNGIYYMYLRKSREDRDAELRGDGETLARHEAQLLKLAESLNIKIHKTYREIVSGETIAARPQMLAMLDAIEAEKVDGVLVVEIERLARGDTRDQGLIMETFKYGGTKIITPMKIYDPNDEFDEEYAEFGLFMSRREYKTINRRLQNGRLASINEGKWIGNKAPYGYERIKIPHDKGFTLRPLEAEAKVVQYVFQLFTAGAPETDNLPIGTTEIAHLLDRLNIKPRFANIWEVSVIQGMLRNYVYIGKLQIGKRKQVKKIIGGIVQTSRPVNQDFRIVDALHPPIIDNATFDQAQKILTANFRPRTCKTIKSPLAGLIYCGVCGKAMYRRPAGAKNAQVTLLCKTHNCPTVGCFYSLAEKKLLDFLDEYLKNYKITVQNEDSKGWSQIIDAKEITLKGYLEESVVLEKQLNNVYDYFEKKIYSLDLFQRRKLELERKISMNKKLIEQTKNEIHTLRDRLVTKENFIPFFEQILGSYYNTDDPVRKNALLKQLVDHVYYTKTKKGNRYGKGVDDFTLDIYLKLPDKIL